MRARAALHFLDADQHAPAYPMLLLVPLCLFFHSLNSPGQDRSASLDKVRDFVYQLEDIDLSRIGTTGFDLAVIDYSSDGSDEGTFSFSEIHSLKHSPGGDKIVISYLSIGEAEDYRFYWRDGWTPGSPPWLDAQNPDWPGNYKVRYWDAEWQAVVFSYLDKILDAGFDGVYCDIIDAYEAYLEHGRSSAAQDMGDFVAAIRSHARSRNPEFLVFVQNGAELASLVPSYLDAVDGIGQEDIYFGYEQDGTATPPEVTAALETRLAVFRDAGKIVLTVDYPFAQSEDVPHYDASTRAKIDRAYGLSLANGFIPYCTVRNLSALTVNPGHEPAAVRQEPRSANPAFLKLLPVYPNPFNGAAVISFQTAASTEMAVRILDILGGEIARPFSGTVGSGMHVCRWDGKDREGRVAPAGVYVVSIEGNGGKRIQKCMLLK